MILHSTIINALTVVVGSLAGFFLSKLFDKSRRFKKLPDALMKAISLCVIIIGIKGAIKDDVDFIIVLISLVVGTTIGSLIKINTLLNKFGDFVERKLVRKKKTASEPITIVNAFITVLCKIIYTSLPYGRELILRIMNCNNGA